VQGTDIQKESAFDMAFYYLERRISLFRNLPLKSLDQLALGARLRGIGQNRGRVETPRGCGMTPMDVIIYHNPRCGTSRVALGLIRNAGVEPQIIDI